MRPAVCAARAEVLSLDGAAFAFAFPNNCGWMVDVPPAADGSLVVAFLAMSLFDVPCPGALLVRNGSATGPVVWRLCGNTAPLFTAQLPVPASGLRLYMALTSPALSTYQVRATAILNAPPPPLSPGRRRVGAAVLLGFDL
jgi:hypothetical protein